MLRAEEVFDQVVFTGPCGADAFVYDAALGFYVLQDQLDRNPAMRTVLGFSVPYAREGGYDEAPTVIPLVNFAELPEEHRTIDKQGKGVGPRLYNLPHALYGLAELPAEAGAYVCTLNLEKIHDTRRTEGGKLRRIARHASRIVTSWVVGVETVTENIHASYGQAPAVLFTQPPRAMLRQAAERGVQTPEGITPEFLIIRDAAMLLRRIGTYCL